MDKQLVLLDQDGGGDDFLSTALLVTMEHVTPLGVVVTPADCFLEPAVEATRKVLDLAGRSDVPVAASTVAGRHDFPHAWRLDSHRINHFPLLNERETPLAPLAPETGQVFTARALQAAPEPATVLATGPLTTLAEALDLAPEIEAKIERLVWMGGALDVPGNVDAAGADGPDGTAEWNVYWDAAAAARIWASRIPIVLCALDVTNNVPCTPEFVRRLTRQRRYPLSDLAGLCYALVLHQDYYFWDVLATAYLGRPDLFTLREVETEIVTAGPSEGRTLVKPGGRRIQALHTVEVEGFYEYVLGQWRR